ncbi:MAG: substrate-binding domain-containing protein [Acidobacteriaceae bacterium]|nr:substrate-binding domain-containing protein [Acidobacteriaceae bacterium]MBV9764573.1 substrate-binding domain-containing protein [Acidobacteriaceae bacterium]
MRQKRSEETPARPNKYGAIFSELREAIASGKYKPGQRIPSEAQLSRTFGASRLTVGRALNELEAAGIVERRAGSGSYVSKIPEQRGRTFGLLIPELGETEIFEPICQGMARVTRINRDELLWGAARHADEPHGQQALELCDYYIAKDVSGVFFAPLEHTPEKNEVNRRVVDAFEKAGIPLVLLDRDAVDYPRRSRCDLVGIDNRRAGYVITEHLLAHGCQRIVFVASPNSAPTVDQRISGYADALKAHGIAPRLEIGDVESAKWISRIAMEHEPDGFVCANDRTAGRLMLHLNELGFEIPLKMKIVGFDDVKYAGLLHVPLTTLRQPCRDIGAAAVWAMIDRIAHPNMSARDILLDCQLIERRSCGAEKS